MPNVAGGQPIEPERGSLGILYEPESVDILALAAAVRGRWPLVWVTDAPVPEAEARLLSRLGHPIETAGLSVDAVAELLRGAGVGGLATFDDRHLLTMAALGEALGVPHNPLNAARCLVDKLAEREALAAAGLPVPAFRGLDPATGLDEVAVLIRDLNFPVVIKPTRGTGGRNTSGAADLQSAVAEFARLAVESDQPLIIEECIGSFPPGSHGGVGDYVSVELLAAGGAFHVLTITGRMPLAPPFRETGAFIPAGLSPDTAAAVEATAVGAAAALGVQVGALHVEIKLTDVGPRVIEINGRAGGGGIPEMLRTLGASDPYRLAAAAAMGETPAVVPVPVGVRTAYALAIQPPLDRPVCLVEDWHSRIEAIPGVDRVRVRAVEATVGIAEGSYGYLIFVQGTVADRAGLLQVYRDLNSLVEPVPTAP